jgi:hypothetical protein
MNIPVIESRRGAALKRLRFYGEGVLNIAVAGLA